MNQRKKLLLGNWKMHKSGREVVEYVHALNNHLENENLECDFGVAPTALHLHVFKSALADQKVVVAAQDAHEKDSGAFTGCVSASQLAADKVQWTLVGHSERRAMFHETDEVVNAKVLNALKHNLTVVFCFGESLEQHDSGATLEVLTSQVKAGLNGVEVSQLSHLVLAYEPIWAIGTGKTATPEDAQTTIKYVRDEVLTALFGAEAAQTVRILYGGSVNLNNVVALTSQPDIDGGLVGGASLDAESFWQMAQLVK